MNVVCRSENAVSVPVRPHGETMTAIGTETDQVRYWDCTS